MKRVSNCTGNDSRKIYKKILFFHFLPRSTELKAEVSFPISVLSHQVWGRRECVCVCVCVCVGYTVGERIRRNAVEEAPKSLCAIIG